MNCFINLARNLQNRGPCLLTDETRANFRRLETSPHGMLALSGGTALASEHMNHSAPSDITAVISMLVLIFLCSGQEQKSAHSESSENYGEKLLTYFHYCFCDCHS